MAAPYVTDDLILAAVGEGSPSAAESDWAAACAAAVEAAIAAVLAGATPSAELEAELGRAAVLDGAAAYQERNAPHGILSVGPDGDAVRLGAELLRATGPVLVRHLGKRRPSAALPGIG